MKLPIKRTWICLFLECFSCLPTLQCPSFKKCSKYCFAFFQSFSSSGFYLPRFTVIYHFLPTFLCTLQLRSLYFDHASDFACISSSWSWPWSWVAGMKGTSARYLYHGIHFGTHEKLKTKQTLNCPQKFHSIHWFHWFHSFHCNVCTVGGAMQTRARAGWTCRDSVSIVTHVTSVLCMTHQWSQTCAPPGLESGQTKRLDQLWRHMVSSTSLQPEKL